MILEVIYIDIASCLLGGIVEDAELGAHEEAAIVEHHAIVLCANLRPLLTIETVEEIGCIASIVCIQSLSCCKGTTFSPLHQTFPPLPSPHYPLPSALSPQKKSRPQFEVVIF